MACAQSARTNQKHPTTQNRFRSSLRPPSHPVHLSPFRSPFTFPLLITLPSPSPNLVLKKRRRPRASATATSRVSHGRLRLSRGLRPGRASKQKNNPPRRVAFAQGFTQRDKTTESEVLARTQRQKRATATRRPVTRVACHLAADRALWRIKLICVQFTLSAI